MKRLALKLSVPGALALSACTTGAGGCDFDAGRQYAPPTDSGCPHPDTIDARGVRCACRYCDNDAGFICSGLVECCDPDVGNPCPICTNNERSEDGGRTYVFHADGTCEPACFT